MRKTKITSIIRYKTKRLFQIQIILFLLLPTITSAHDSDICFSLNPSEWEYYVFQKDETEIHNTLQLSDLDSTRWNHENLKKALLLKDYCILLRYKLPQIECKAPALYIPFGAIKSPFEVFIDNESIYAAGSFNSWFYNYFLLVQRHIIPITNQYENKYLYIKLKPYTEQESITIDSLVIGNNAFFIVEFLKNALDEVILAFLFLIIGIFSLFLYLKKRETRMPAMLAFAIMTIIIGINIYIASGTSMLFYKNGYFKWLVFSLTLLIFPPSILMLIEQLIKKGKKSILRVMALIHVIYCIIAIIIVHLFAQSVAVLVFVFFIISFSSIFFVAKAFYNEILNNNREAKIMGISIIVLAVFIFLDMFMIFDIINIGMPFLFHWGVFVFILFLAFLLFEEFEKAEYKLRAYSKQLAIKKIELEKSYQKLETYSHELEDKVKERTKELQKNNEKLYELNATKDKFFSIIAHDLKNPFSSLIGYSEILIKNYEKFPAQKTKKFISSINSSAKYGSELLQNLLQWARAQTGRIKWEPKKTTIDDLVLEAIFIHKIQAEKKNIELINEATSTLSCYADYSMVSTVLRNLIANAIKFTKQGGRIVIKSEQEGEFIKISIKDNGIGISQENIDKLFRIDEHHTTQGTDNESGTGLGLILSKEFVEKHGGKIGVKSKTGEGSTFYFTLPKKQNGVNF